MDIKRKLPPFILFLFFLISWLNIVSQTTDQIIVVKAKTTDPSVPHMVHEGALFTLKAILRNTSASGYTVSWDIDGNGSYDQTFNVTENTAINGVRDIGVLIYAPGVSSDQMFIAIVKVKNNTTMNETYASYPYLVYNWTPGSNPLGWTDEQIIVMREMAIQETLWYLHRQLAYLGGAGVANMTGHYGHANTDSHALQAFLGNGHFPAYPPGTLNNYGYTLPAGWQTRNDWVWNTNPYAETVLRIMNYQLSTLSSLTIPSGSEDSTIGYNQSGVEIVSNRITGTTNNKAIKTSLAPNDAGLAEGGAHILSGFAKALYTHDGVPVQVGGSGIIGKPMEYIVQEMVDYLVYHQIDGGPGAGGFHYDPYEGSTNVSMGETGAGVARGLWDTQRFYYPYGIIVNNKVKYRMAENVYYQQGTGNLAKRYGQTSFSNNNFNYTGGYLGLCHWLGIDDFTISDNTVAFPGYSTRTRGQLRTAYNNYLNAATPLWTSSSKLDPYNYLDHFWQNGDFLSGSPTGVYNQNLGSTFNMYQWVSGLSNAYSLITYVGSHDWQKEITIHLIRGQDKLSNSSTFGGFYDDYCTYTSHSCIYNPPLWSTVIAGRSLSDMQNLEIPVAVVSGLPEQVEAGDTVYFSHAGSYTGSKLDIIVYQWDVNLSDGLWWENGDSDDFSTTDPDEVFHYIYSAPGTYTATLLVRDNSGHSDTATIDITGISAKSPPGNSLVFDGDEGYVSVSNNIQLQPAGAFTLEAWVYVDSTVNGACVIDNGYFTGGSINKCGGYSLGVISDTADRFTFRVSNGVNYPSNMVTISASTAFEEDCWNHVAAVNSGSELILFVNGLEQGRVTFSGNVNYTRVNNDPGYGLNIGCFKDDDEELVFCGKIDEVRIWGDERTAQEIRDNICCILSGNEDQLRAYYRFDYDAGAVTMDDFSPRWNFAFLGDMDSSSVWTDSEAFNTWLGTSDTVWHNPANWSDGVPESNGNIGISSASHQPFITTPDTCRILVISSGTTLVIQTDSLVVNGNVLNNGSLTVNDTLLNNQATSTFINMGTLHNNGMIYLRRLVNDETGNIVIHEGKEIWIEENE